MIRPKSSILKGEAQKPDSFENFVIDNALNVPISLSSAPTTTGNQLASHGDIGYNSTNLYIRLGATTYRIALTTV